MQMIVAPRCRWHKVLEFDNIDSNKMILTVNKCRANRIGVDVRNQCFD